MKTFPRSYAAALAILLLTLPATWAGIFPSASTPAKEDSLAPKKPEVRPAPPSDDTPVNSSELAWDPAHTFVFGASLLSWQDKETFGSFPTAGRRDTDLINFFRKSGIDSSHITFLQDKAVTLAALNKALPRLLAKTGPGDLLIFYYQGHGYESDADAKRILFAPYDANIGDVEGWAVQDIVSTIDANFAGDRVLLIADCCHSGAMASAVRRIKSRISYFCLNSSSSKKQSTGNWTYTESVLAAFRGNPAADLDGDGAISIDETRKYCAERMRTEEDQRAVSLINGTWDDEDVLAITKKTR